MKCQTCGAVNETGAAFCEACGEKLTSGKTLDNSKPLSPKTDLPEKTSGAFPNKAPGFAAPPTSFCATAPAPVRKPPRKKTRKQLRREKRDAYVRSRLPFIITSFLAALVSLAQFVIPFYEWVSYEFSLLGYNLSKGAFNLIDLAYKFYYNDNLYSFVMGSADTYGVSAWIPDSVHQQFAEGRTAAIWVSVIFVVSLVLYLAFIVVVGLRRRIGAAALGIAASVFNAFGCIGVMYAVRLLNDMVVKYDNYSWNVVDFQTLAMPYVGLALSASVIILCVAFIILGIHTKKKRKL